MKRAGKAISAADKAEEELNRRAEKRVQRVLDDRDRLRRRLYAAVDEIVDGPGTGDVDGWVRSILVGIGLIVRTAHPALHYEAGRTLRGVDRPVGDFPRNQHWEGAGITATPEQAEDWVAAGAAARANVPQFIKKKGAKRGALVPSPETIAQQRALTAILRPIANISCCAWLLDLTEALDVPALVRSGH